MLKLKDSVCIDAPAEEAWRVLSQLDAIQHWVKAIQRSHCPGQDRDVGALRICELGSATVKETIIEWDEGRSFRYRGEGAPLIKSATNRWSVVPHGQQSLVVSEAEAELKGGFLGRVLERVARPAFARMGRRSLASLKYYVEHGKAYEGSTADLLPIQAAC